MKTSKTKRATELTICNLVVEIEAKVEEGLITAKAAAALARRGKALSALHVIMGCDGPLHDSLDLFRAGMTLRSHLLSTSDE